MTGVIENVMKLKPSYIAGGNTVKHFDSLAVPQSINIEIYDPIIPVLIYSQDNIHIKICL